MKSGRQRRTRSDTSSGHIALEVRIDIGKEPLQLERLSLPIQFACATFREVVCILA